MYLCCSSYTNFKKIKKVLSFSSGKAGATLLLSYSCISIFFFLGIKHAYSVELFAMLVSNYILLIVCAYIRHFLVSRLQIGNQSVNRKASFMCFRS